MSDELTWLPAWRITELIRSRDLAPSEVLQHFLGRIEEHQDTLRAMAHIDERRATREAAQADRALLSGEEIGPLHGIPIAVKRHIDIEGAPRTLPFGTGVAPADDITVERLRRAGAIVVGHTSMPILRDDGSYDHGLTARNPWDRSRTPGISSSGSAAAVGGGLLPVALGSDGQGSVRVPAAYCGVVGVHPTAGLVPWVDDRGQTSSTTATIGPLARDVRDAADVLAAIAGPDPRDQAALHLPLADPRSELEGGAGGLRLGWTDDLGYALDHAVEESARVIRAIREAAMGADRIGAVVESISESWDDHLQAMRTYSVAGLASMGIEGVAEVSEQEWREAASARRRALGRFEALFERYDLLLCPTIHSVAPPVDDFARRIPTGFSLLQGGPGPDSYTVYTGQFNWLRHPAASVPCGTVDGLPIGLQIVGPPGSDARLLRFARAFTEMVPQPGPWRPSSGDDAWTGDPHVVLTKERSDHG